MNIDKSVMTVNGLIFESPLGGDLYTTILFPYNMTEPTPVSRNEGNENHDVAVGPFEDNTVVLDSHGQTAGYLAVADNDISGGGFRPGYGLTPQTFDLSIADFLARPKLIFSGTQSSLPINLTPLVSLMNTITILQKTRNLKLMRGTIVVKVIVTAMPFAYGQLIVAKHIDPIQNVGFENPNTAAAISATLGARVAAYTKTHSILDFGLTNQAVLEIPIQLPFLAASVNIPDAWYASFVAMIMPLTAVRAANTGDVTTYSISVYASIKDAEVFVPVYYGNNAAYVTSETVKANRGQVGITDAMVDLGMKAIGIPKLAKATNLGARLGQAAASWLGLSRPPLVTEPNYPTIPIASIGETPFRTKPLVLDPTQEVSLDVGMIGDDGDNLSFKNILAREGIVANFPWSSEYPVGEVMINVAVRPIRDRPPLSVTTPHFMTPLEYGSRLFSMWRGSLIYKFVFPANKFIRGKVRLIWDPAIYNTGTGTFDLSAASNTVPSVVLDVSTNTVAEMIIPWALQDNYLSVDPPLTLSGPPLATSTPSSNGTIRMVVEEPLRAIAEGVSLEVYVTVRAGEDFVLAVPTTLNTLAWHPNAGGAGSCSKWLATTRTVGNGFANTAETVQDPGDMYAYVTSSTHAPDNAGVISLAPELNVGNGIGHVAVGEEFESFRPLCRRLTKITELFAGTNASGRRAAWALPRYLPINYVKNGTTFITNTRGSYPVATTPMSWLAQCFVGQRGSTNWMAVPTQNDVTLEVRRGRLPQLGLHHVQLSNAPAVSTMQHTIDAQGSQAHNAYQSKMGEPVTWTMPWQCNRLYDCDKLDSCATFITSKHVALVASTAPDTDWGANIWQGAGEDYMPVIWNGVPLMFNYKPIAT